jgi:adenylate kinase
VALNVVMLGPPGAGKGTQAERFAQRHRLPKISTGDILREAVQEGTELGRIATATMDAGNLVGDEVMIGIVSGRLTRPDAKSGFVLDGFPRTVVQAGALDQMMTGRGDCGSNALVEWTTSCGKCGGTLVQRTDDGDGIVRERLKVYHRQTKPLVDYYSGRPTFRTIDGNQPPDVVTASLDSAICEASTIAHGARL